MSFQRERKDDENGGFSITRSSQVVSLGVPMCGNGDDVASAEMKLLVRAGEVRPSTATATLRLRALQIAANRNAIEAALLLLNALL